MATISSRSHDVADYIIERRAFKTYGALMAVDGAHYSMGQLSGDDAARYTYDIANITYTVVSYDTPIAWYTDKWYKVKAKFSPTTSKHQGKLPLING